LATGVAQQYSGDTGALTIVILGGDLAAEVCTALDVGALDVRGVACGGGGVCRIVGPMERSDRHLVLRSGAFGADNVLIDAVTHRVGGAAETDG
jgi:uncharacterized protein YgbK (DUF1537 family)